MACPMDSADSGDGRRMDCKLELQATNAAASSKGLNLFIKVSVPCEGCTFSAIACIRMRQLRQPGQSRPKSKFAIRNRCLGLLQRVFQIWHASCFTVQQYNLETGWPGRLNTGAFVWAGQSSNSRGWVLIEALSPILHPTRIQSPGFRIDPCLQRTPPRWYRGGVRRSRRSRRSKGGRMRVE
jgi:hypothetical protein